MSEKNNFPIGTTRRALLLSAAAFTACVEKSDNPNAISANEAAKLYKDLYEAIKRDYGRAKNTGKNYRIIIGEAHFDPTSEAIGLMAIDIAKKLGINDVLFETRPDTPESVFQGQRKRIRHLRMNSHSIDTYFPTEQQANETQIREVQRLDEALARIYLSSLYPNLNLPSTIFKASGLDVAYIRDELLGQISEADKKHLRDLHSTNAARVLWKYQQLRDPVMNEILKSKSPCVAIFGTLHVKSQVQPLRDVGDIDTTITLFRKSKDENIISHYTQEQKDALAWATDSKNGLFVYEGKPFDGYKDLSNFVDQVIALAEKQYSINTTIKKQ
jgi:hypothetical protein